MTERYEAKGTLKERKEIMRAQLEEALAILGLGDELKRARWTLLLNNFSESPMEITPYSDGVEVDLTVGGKPLRIKFGQDFLRIERMGKDGITRITQHCGLRNMRPTDIDVNFLLLDTNDGSVTGIEKGSGGKVNISYLGTRRGV